MYLCSSRTVDTVEAAAVDLAMLRSVVRPTFLAFGHGDKILFMGGFLLCPARPHCPTDYSKRSKFSV